MIQIETNIPVPTRNAGGKYPFPNMNVGDSFAIAKSEKGSKSLSAAARTWAVTNGFTDRKFSMRTNGTTVRLWRVA